MDSDRHRGGAAPAPHHGHLAALAWSERRGGGAVGLEDLAEHLADLALPLGVLLGLVAVVLPAVAAVANTDLSRQGAVAQPITEAQLEAFAVVAGTGHVVAAVLVGVVAGVAVRRGRSLAAIVLAPIAVSLLAVALAGVDEARAVSEPAVTLGLCLVLIPVVGLAWLTGRMNSRRWTIAVAAQLLCALWPWYPVLLEPLGLFAGSHGLAVLVVGLLWYLATEAEYANAGGPRWTRGAAMMLFYAHSAVLVLFAFLIDDVLGATYWETFDESLFTVAVPLAAMAALAHQATGTCPRPVIRRGPGAPGQV
ncbi:hypothetical protein ACQCX2_07395 [Propionibacteriaceae bacterium Y1700]|uniref:hypothetical protein n=1 Tax=Microlunatus sp. Y1700 TaxID=3418487 RepID=UPI003DA71875